MRLPEGIVSRMTDPVFAIPYAIPSISLRESIDYFREDCEATWPWLQARGGSIHVLRVFQYVAKLSLLPLDALCGMVREHHAEYTIAVGEGTLQGHVLLSRRLR